MSENEAERIPTTAESQKTTAKIGNRKPPNAGKGRPKGTKNKFTKSAKDVIDKAFSGLGGEQALIAWANASDRNKGAFYTLIWSKIIPKNIDLTAHHTHDIATRLLEARNKAKQLQAANIIEVDDKGKIIEEAIEHSVIEEIEEEETREEDWERKFEEEKNSNG